MVFMGEALVAVVRPIFCSPTLSSSLFPAHPIFSPSLFLAHVHLSILMESPHPLPPLREGGTEGVDNALTKGSKRAGTKQFTSSYSSDEASSEVWTRPLRFFPSFSFGPSVLAKIATGVQASSGESPVADYP